MDVGIFAVLESIEHGGGEDHISEIAHAVVEGLIRRLGATLLYGQEGQQLVQGHHTDVLQ